VKEAASGCNARDIPVIAKNLRRPAGPRPTAPEEIVPGGPTSIMVPRAIWAIELRIGKGPAGANGCLHLAGPITPTPAITSNPRCSSRLVHQKKKIEPGPTPRRRFDRCGPNAIFDGTDAVMLSPAGDRQSARPWPWEAVGDEWPSIPRKTTEKELPYGPGWLAELAPPPERRRRVPSTIRLRGRCRGEPARPEAAGGGPRLTGDSALMSAHRPRRWPVCWRCARGPTSRAAAVPLAMGRAGD